MKIRIGITQQSLSVTEPSLAEYIKGLDAADAPFYEQKFPIIQAFKKVGSSAKAEVEGELFSLRSKKKEGSLKSLTDAELLEWYPKVRTADYQVRVTLSTMVKVSSGKVKLTISYTDLEYPALIEINVYPDRNDYTPAFRAVQKNFVAKFLESSATFGKTKYVGKLAFEAKRGGPALNIISSPSSLKKLLSSTVAMLKSL